MPLKDKNAVRAMVWADMDRENVSRFPGAEGRIPNFAGAKRAAIRLSEHPIWTSAKTIKANPDAPQTHARRLALEQGKRLVIAVPRLHAEHPFRLLDPARLGSNQRREAATIKGALRHGDVIDLEQVPSLDLVLSGSVAVNLKGARIGKGGGYSDLEYGLLRETGALGPDVPIATTVHPIQVLRENLLMTEHDIAISVITTPRSTIELESAHPEPRGILWHHLQPPQIREIPVLERFGYGG